MRIYNFYYILLFYKIKYYEIEIRLTSINNTPEKYFNPINTKTNNQPIFE